MRHSRRTVLSAGLGLTATGMRRSTSSSTSATTSTRGADHEVANDYAALHSGQGDPPELFLARRAAASDRARHELGRDDRRVMVQSSSEGRPQSSFDRWLGENPNVRLARSDYRGYVRATVAPEQLHADLVAVDDVTRADSPTHVLASFEVENGRPGIAR